MKRLLVLIAVLVPLSFFIAGCGGTGGSSGKSGKFTEEQKQQMKESMMKNMGKTQAPGGEMKGNVKAKL